MKLIEKIKSFFREEKSARITLGPSTGLDDTFLFDFKNYQSQYTGVTMNSFISVGGADSDSSGDEISSGSQKIAVKPKDVLEELETVPTPWTLSNLDDN